jgi:hypothetical protein
MQPVHATLVLLQRRHKRLIGVCVSYIEKERGRECVLYLHVRLVLVLEVAIGKPVPG